MEGMNQVFLLGSLGAAPELRYTQGGTPVLNMRLATNGRYQNKDKEWVEATEWHSCVCFGARAEGLAKILDKGSSMLIEGSLRTSSYEKDGVKRYKTEIVCKAVRLVGGKRSGGDGGEEPRGNNDGGDDGGAAPSRGGGQRQQAPRQSGGGGGGGVAYPGVKSAGDYEIRFGDDKGKRISQVEDLSGLRAFLVKGIEDPARATYAERNKAQVNAIDEEIARRSGGGASKPARAPSGGGYATRGGGRGRAAAQVDPEQSGAPGGGGDDFGSDEFDTGGYGDDGDIPF